MQLAKMVKMAKNNDDKTNCQLVTNQVLASNNTCGNPYRNDRKVVICAHSNQSDILRNELQINLPSDTCKVSFTPCQRKVCSKKVRP